MPQPTGNNTNCSGMDCFNLYSAEATQCTRSLRISSPCVGVQIYECKIIDGKPAAWAFASPEADLFDESGARVGKHYAGPTWELNDGSKIVGTVKERADSATPRAIPCLLLSAKSTGSAGKLEKVSSFQRFNKMGGVAPATGCTADDIGKQARVYYKADYVYFAAK